ncbi:Endonuclease/exonuclease/phosphatase [Niveomyces insectorum RCEF 264]|uniref:polynucleotide adenylyltransferase n=1 Tax=Niveomyces insectorum RCEF 264 TaxID=1081102 RepID=A0A167PHX5_9HYPO|nr:Endonuclease/exonuclease/phosphatase [Niveomyces insectorum RCEF 264]
MATSGDLPEPVPLTLNSYDTAVCLVPPTSCWPPVDRLRSLYDKAYRKWPPHVNLIYPFVRPESLEAASKRIQSALRDERAGEIKSRPADVRLDMAGVFPHRHDNTLFLRDSREENGSTEPPLQRLRADIAAALTGRQPTAEAGAANDHHDGYCLHMAVAQSSGAVASNLGTVNAASDDAASTAPNDTMGHAHRFLLHKVELLPPVTWQADRLHILVRERLTTQNCKGDVVTATSHMRLWGVVHLADGQLEKFDRPEPFYDPLPLGTVKKAGAVEADREENDEDNPSQEDIIHLESFNAVMFAPEDAEWIECSDDHSLYEPDLPAPAALLSIATYNVLGEFSWPPSRTRFPLLIRNVLAAHATADVLVLQEVTDDFLSELLADDSVRAAYPFASHGPPDQHDMEPLPSLLNMVVLSRRPFSWSWLGFQRAHKGALIARFGGDGGKYSLVLATVHLTHGLTTGSVASKRAELLRLLGYLRCAYPDGSADAAVIAGDLNIHTSSLAIQAAVQRKAISPQTAQYVTNGFDELLASYGFVDAWRAAEKRDKGEETEDECQASGNTRDHSAAYDGEDGATYNPHTNALAAQIIGTGLNNRPQRFDRILVRHPAANRKHGNNTDGGPRYNSDFVIAQFNLFGFQAGDNHNDRFSLFATASDHWGVRCVLERLGHGEVDMPASLAAVSAPSLTNEDAAVEAERPLISAEVAKLVVPVVPIRVAEGPLAAAGGVHAALEHLGVLPSTYERLRRKAAFDLLKSILLGERSLTSTTSEETPPPDKDLRRLVVVPVGSYGLGVWTPASDIDCLCIGTFSAKTFFALASQRLRAATTAAGAPTTTIQIVRRVRAHTGTMLELTVDGIHVDLQYIQAGVIAVAWPAALSLPQTHPTFLLPPSTLAKLKAVRDLHYLHTSFPEESTTFRRSNKRTGLCTADTFRTAHRAIKTWARARGLYAARFGYLGGIQIAVLLARVLKLMDKESCDEAVGLDSLSSENGDNDSNNNNHPSYSLEDVLATFFRHYAQFDWAAKMAFDPFFHNTKSPYTPTAREPLAILGYHRPQLNTSLAASTPSVRVLADEFRRADRILSEAKCLTWVAFLSGGEDADRSLQRTPSAAGALAPGPAEFVRAYRTYIKLDLQYWGLSLAHGAAFVGWIESRCVLLLVDLARRLPTLNARFWPGRFVDGTQVDVDEAAEEVSNKTHHEDGDHAGRQYQGCYLIGLDLPASLTRDERRVALGTLQSVLATFEKQIRHSGEEGTPGGLRNYDPQWQWMGVGIVNRAELGDVARLRLDTRAWGEYALGDEEEEEEGDDDDDTVDEVEEDGDEGEPEQARADTTNKRSKKGKGAAAAKRLPMAVVHHRPGSAAKLRTAQDVLQRLRWDPHRDRSDYVVGYEDRFAGAREKPLEAWKAEQTDEEFIPQHRILYFRRRSDGAVVWDRRTRRDDVFGSGLRDA